jgi:rhodanese-related sulfurtransferase
VGRFKMKTTLVVLLVVVVTSGLAHAHTDVTPAQVKAMIDAGGPLTIVDVREESEFCDSTSSPPGHIPGAINMPWYSGYLQDHYGELPTDEDIVVVCRSGGRSNLAANFLDGVGFTMIFDMLGGMNAWVYDTQLCGLSSVTLPGASASGLVLESARPNPFGASAEIAYSVPEGEGWFSLRIYDTRGRLVDVVVDDIRGSGAGRAVWNGMDERGRSVPSGVYFCRLTWNGESMTRPMVLAR